MRLLHTSDWHIGRSLHGTDLLTEQEAVLGALAEVVVAQSVVCSSRRGAYGRGGC